jgi:hypothetical protein
MTKKDYQMVAAVLNRQRNGFLADASNESLSRMSQRLLENYSHGIEVSAEALADEFERENPRFDRDRFLIACGVSR